MEIHESLSTIEDYEAFIALPENRERRFELIHGEIISPPAYKHKIRNQQDQPTRGF